MENKKLIIAGIIFLCIGLMLGFYIGKTQGGDKVAEYNALTQKVNTLFPRTIELAVLSGYIKEIKSDSIMVDVTNSLNPFENFPALREVKISSSTEMVVLKPKSDSAYAKELADYKAHDSQGRPPTKATESKISLKNLVTGQMVAIISDKDIKSDVVITSVSKIRVTPQ